jgi:hypothetical protein
LRRSFVVVLILLALAEYGGIPSVRGAPFATPQINCVHSSVPTAPKAAPDWLINRTCRIARGLGDAHPNQIVIRLDVREHGRIVDRVWMRGSFTFECPGLMIGTCHGALAGYTFDARTRQTVAVSLRGR